MSEETLTLLRFHVHLFSCFKGMFQVQCGALMSITTENYFAISKKNLFNNCKKQLSYSKTLTMEVNGAENAGRVNFIPVNMRPL